MQRSAAVSKTSRRDQRKKVSFLWPRNTHRRAFADERGQVFLPLPKGEGRGEGEERVKISHALQTSRAVPLTLNPSPRGRGKRVIPPKCSFSSLAAISTRSNVVISAMRFLRILTANDF